MKPHVPSAEPLADAPRHPPEAVARSSRSGRAVHLFDQDSSICSVISVQELTFKVG
jgi:hypothetical protein